MSDDDVEILQSKNDNHKYLSNMGETPSDKNQIEAEYNEIDHSTVKKRKKRVQFIDDDENDIITSDNTTTIKKKHKKTKLLNENVTQKEFLESILFESDDSDLSSDAEEITTTPKAMGDVVGSAKAHEKRDNDSRNNKVKDDPVDYYTKNILDKMNFSDSDDMDDFIEHDDESNILASIHKKGVTTSHHRNKALATTGIAGTTASISGGDISTYMNSLSNRQINEANISNSYRVALDVFGEDYNIDDIFAGSQEQFGDKIVDDDEEEEDYVSDDKYMYEEDDNTISTSLINRRNVVQKSIYELYEPVELERQFLTDKDEEIRTKDIPERFQLRSNPVKSGVDDTELEKEANWIYTNYFEQHPTLLTTDKRDISTGTSLSSSSARKNSSPNELISTIKVTLDLIRNELCEIPFILTYRHENINGLFNEDELWTIYRADNKWLNFSNKITNYMNYLNRLSEYQSSITTTDKSFYYKISDRDIRYLKSITNEFNFNSFYNKIQLYNSIYKNDLLTYESKLMNTTNNQCENSTNSNVTCDIPQKDPSSFSRHYFYITKDIGHVVEHFGLSSSDFDDNIRVQYRKYIPKLISPSSSTTIAEKYISNVFDTCDKVIDAAIDMYSIELSHEPHIRQYIYHLFLKNAKLNIQPTKNGIIEIDETHPYTSFKYISNKPLKSITSEMFIKIDQAKQEKLLHIDICLPENIRLELMDYLETFQNISSSSSSSSTATTITNRNVDNENFQNEWCKLRCKAIDRAVNIYLIPSIRSAIYNKLLIEANDDMIKYCGDIFKNHLIASPFLNEFDQFKLRKKNKVNNNLTDRFDDADVDVDNSPYIMVISLPLLAFNDQHKNKYHFGIKAIHGNINHSLMNDKYSTTHTTTTNSNHEDNIFTTAGYSTNEIGYLIIMDEYGECVEYATINNSILLHPSSATTNANHHKFNELSFKKIEKLLTKYNTNICGIFIPLMDRNFNNLANTLTNRIKNMKIKYKPVIHLVNPYISNQLMKAMSMIDSTFASNKLEYEKALSIGRYAIDPLIECVKLFINDHNMIFLNDLLLPYQKYLRKEQLYGIFEEKLVSIVNEIGVDINRVCINERYSYLLYYVCGLGPRKAQRLINDIISNSNAGQLNNRTQLVTMCNLGPKIFINCAGFLKIIGSIDEEGDIELLDTTRIHPELYDWARTIMIDALDIEEQHHSTTTTTTTSLSTTTTTTTSSSGHYSSNNDTTKKYDYNDMLETLRNDPKKLNDLDLDAFANELIRQGISLNKKYSLELITTEMLKEFPDYRPKYMPLNSKEKFWILINGGSRIDLCDTLEYNTLLASSKNLSNSLLSRFHNEDLVPVYIGKLVSFIATSFIYKRPDQDEITKAVPNKDLESQLWKCPFCYDLISHDLKKCWNHIENQCPGNAIGVRGILDGFYSTITGIINLTHISDNPPNNIKQRVQKGMQIMCQVINIKFDRLTVNLTCRTSDLCDQKYECLKFKRDVYYDIKSEDEQRELNKKKAEELKNQVVYLKKVIIHPSFKNISFDEAEKQLATSSIGDCIIRPSSKGNDHLTVTWKVHDNIYQHIDVIEVDKPNHFSLGKKLWIKGECYEDLDEIIARHIIPMSNLVKEIINLKVYNYADGGSRHKMATILSEEKKSNPYRIPYIFSPSKIYPGKFLLGFLPRNTPIFEYVSITPDGVKFREIIHTSFQEMIKWFKSNFSLSNNLLPLPSSSSSSTTTTTSSYHTLSGAVGTQHKTPTNYTTSYVSDKKSYSSGANNNTGGNSISPSTDVVTNQNSSVYQKKIPSIMTPTTHTTPTTTSGTTPNTNIRTPRSVINNPNYSNNNIQNFVPQSRFHK